MCGIHVVVSRDGFQSLPAATQACLCNRGPDHLGEVQSQSAPVESGSNPVFLNFTSTVLALRGDHIIKQPFRDASSGSVLCWNGEAWKIGSAPVEGNDGEAIFALLTAASNRDANEDAVLDVLRSIEGPFAFVYYDATACRVYYGRDRLGRRSLLLNQGEDLRLSSIAESTSPAWAEVEADGIYVLDLAGWSRDSSSPPSPRSWTPGETETVLNIGVFNMALPPSNSQPLSASSPSVQAVRQQLTESLKLRVLDIPEPPAHEANNDTRVAVLFSGGLDCTVLARMASDILPSEQGIDLINVAFENPRLAAKAEQSSDGLSLYEACPDRITGRKSFAELAAICPARRWRFVAVDVPYQEVLAHRSQVISLMYPHNTEMDLSIAYALYFAARGVGMSQCHPSDASASYATPARVLLSGLGADELFGGYVRHATAFSRRGHSGLLDELKLDVSRLGKRNLGRDDRAMAHWGREVRFPYLDEEFVKWSIETPVWAKCDFGFTEADAEIEPGKRVLRLLAEALGMVSVAREKKRAIQFGSRTAKMESGKTKGTTLIAP
ncbi:asparagine synthetase domain-containing protein C4F6.11c [Colletotrichum spaethianum]|uniref:Asparagine synthetase domain-containing protein C4F6.11c n=1 Tax=Colletotrichum spaethianum TaxID=700344 RepID=A0AA37UJK9_9PEZI|nr:asparagine synthetase domain-containing protein C4F6.11c [Colletotrichum spaethianum]GKT48241.1 asparagine synthetase domain-containing protein C4F6.11c [Colletotrichum spaethianum]